MNGALLVAKKVVLVYPSPADGSSLGGPCICVLGEFLPFHVTGYFEVLELSLVRDLGQIAHFLPYGGDLFVFADNTVGGSYYGATTDLWTQRATSVQGSHHGFVDETVAFFVGEKVVDKKDEGLFVDQLKSWVFCIDLLEVWAGEIFVKG